MAVRQHQLNPTHGRRRIAALIKGVVDEARADGVCQLELFVDTENHRAIGFYEKAGFERVGFHPDGVRIDGVSRDDFFYVLRINEGEGLVSSSSP